VKYKHAILRKKKVSLSDFSLELDSQLREKSLNCEIKNCKSFKMFYSVAETSFHNFQPIFTFIKK